jgi:hypothetical protein
VCERARLCVPVCACVRACVCARVKPCPRLTARRALTAAWPGRGVGWVVAGDQGLFMEEVRTVRLFQWSLELGVGPGPLIIALLALGWQCPRLSATTPSNTPQRPATTFHDTSSQFRGHKNARGEPDSTFLRASANEPTWRYCT